MKSIDAVIFRGTIMPWSLLIMLGTWSWFSHGTLLVSNGDVMEAVAGGIREGKHKRPWYAWEIRRKLNLPLADRQRMYQQAVERKEKSHGYDWRYYLAYLFNVPTYQVRSRDVCWEFVYHVISPHIEIGKNPARIVGRHVWRALKRA